MFPNIRRALGRRINVDLPIIGFGGAGIMLGGKEPVDNRANLGLSYVFRLSLCEDLTTDKGFSCRISIA